MRDNKEARQLMETNVYAVRGKVLVAGACLPQVYPQAFARLADRIAARKPRPRRTPPHQPRLKRR